MINVPAGSAGQQRSAQVGYIGDPEIRGWSPCSVALLFGDPCTPRSYAATCHSAIRATAMTDYVCALLRSPPCATKLSLTLPLWRASYSYSYSSCLSVLDHQSPTAEVSLYIPVLLPPLLWCHCANRGMCIRLTLPTRLQ